MRALFIIAILPFFIASQSTFQAQAWQSHAKSPDYVYGHWPEQDYPEIMSRKNVAISFSGGGSRAYICALGYLAGLNKLGLLKNVRYIAGISGGSWATSSYTYYKFGSQPGMAKDDATLLGPVVDPSNITMENLKLMDSGCIRKSATTSFYEAIFGNLMQYGSDRVWERTIWDLYLKPCGIGWNDSFTWSTESLKSILLRNPNLKESNFVLPSAPRPYLVIGISLMGPHQLEPFVQANRSYTMTEATALYTGDHYVRNVEYVSEKKVKATYVLGGLKESFAFGGIGHKTIPDNQSNWTIPITREAPMRLARAVGGSSFAPADAIAQDSPIRYLTDKLEIVMPYFSPATAAGDQGSVDMMYGDGGIVANPCLIGLLRRKVEHIIVFINADQPLAPSSRWNPFTTPAKPDLITDDITAFFGIPGMDKNVSFGYDLKHDKVFSEKDFPAVVAALQASQAKGKGAIATTPLVTIENSWWGIPAGQKVDVTWAYLTRAIQWEQALPTEVRQHVVPTINPTDPSSLVRFGPFANFPHYSTGGQITQTVEQANLLADLTGWIAIQNADLFNSILQ